MERERKREIEGERRRSEKENKGETARERKMIHRLLGKEIMCVRENEREGAREYTREKREREL